MGTIVTNEKIKDTINSYISIRSDNYKAIEFIQKMFNCRFWFGRAHIYQIESKSLFKKKAPYILKHFLSLPHCIKDDNKTITVDDVIVKASRLCNTYPFIKRSLNDAREISLVKYRQIPYFLTIESLNTELENIQPITITVRKRNKYIPFFYDVDRMSYGVRYARLGYSIEPMDCIDIVYSTQQEQWYHKIDYFELYTRKPFLKKAKGHVLVLGLEIGFLASMLNENSKITQITVVESSASKIDFFQNTILKKFANPSKITVINATPFQFLKEIKDGEYSFIYYQDFPFDGAGYYENMIRYFRFKQNCKNFIVTKTECWREMEHCNIISEIMIDLLAEWFMETANPQQPIQLLEQDNDNYQIRRLYTFVREIVRELNITSPTSIKIALNPRNIPSITEKGNLAV